MTVQSCFSHQLIANILVQKHFLSYDTRGLIFIFGTQYLVNECTDASFDCDDNASCIDKMDGYSCKCNVGYNGNGKACQKQDLTNCRTVSKQYNLASAAFKDKCKAGFESIQESFVFH